MEKVIIDISKLVIGKPLFTYNFNIDSLNLNGFTPLMAITLYERLNVCVNCDRCRDRKLPLDKEFIKLNNIGSCKCKPDAEFYIRHIIISIVGNPINTLPLDSIYHIDAFFGRKTIKINEDINNIFLRNDITGLEHISFSIYNSMDENDDTNKNKVIDLFTYKRIYYRETQFADKYELNYFTKFTGLKKSDAYGLHFFSIVENYMKPSIQNTEKKICPHIAKK
jgi:hypothetical protein